MSSAGTAKKFDIRGLFRNFWVADEVSDSEENDIEKIETKFENVTEKDLEELKKSSSTRLKTLEDKYGIEPKKLRARSKAPKTKSAVIRKENIVKENQKQNRVEQEEIDRDER